MHSVAVAGAAAASVYRTVRPIMKTGSPLMTDRKPVRTLGVHEVPLARLRRAGRAAGGTVNDAFLAGVTGGLRLYHEKHGVAVADLHMTMPISLRAEGDDIGGNRITLMRYDVPAGVSDAAQRIREIHRRATRVRNEKSLPYTQLIAGASEPDAARVHRIGVASCRLRGQRRTGFPVPVFLAGAAVQNHYAFGPTIGAAVNVTLMSYVDTCAFGINVDSGAIPDYDVFHDALVAGFDEVLALAD